MKLSQVLLVSVASSVSTLLIAALALSILIPEWRANFAIQAQQFQLRLPEMTPMTVQISEPIETRLATVLDLAFPIDEVLPLELPGPVEMDVEIDAQVPIQAVLDYDDVVPLDAKISTRIFGIPMVVPVKGDIPLKLSLPVEQVLAIKFKAPVTVTMRHPIEVPLKVDFNTQIPLDQAISIPVTQPLQTLLKMPDQAIPVEMSGELDVQLKALHP